MGVGAKRDVANALRYGERNIILSLCTLQQIAARKTSTIAIFINVNGATGKIARVKEEEEEKNLRNIRASIWKLCIA